MTFASSLMGGVSGVMSLFTGFANVNEYRIARQEKEAAFVEREQACLTVMTEVVRAYLNLENALDDKALADQALAAAEARLREVDAQWQEGLVNGPDKIAAVAERDAAQANVTNARFQEQVVIAALRSVLGTTYMEQEVKSDAE
jgi:outer membrane protein TolC